ncbi:hypothetical protein BKA82DRAFT_4222808, partial [Pisolithus tinctorius]
DPGSIRSGTLSSHKRKTSMLSRSTTCCVDRVLATFVRVIAKYTLSEAGGIDVTPRPSGSVLIAPRPPRSSHRRASHSVPLVEYDSSLLSPPPFSPRSPAFSDSGADTHKLHHQRRASSPARSESITSSARMRSRMDALACLEGRGRLGSNFMSMSDGEDEEGDGESNRRDIIVTRPWGEEIRLSPTICVEDVGLMGDVEDEGAKEGQSPSTSSRLFVSNKRIRKRFSPSPARSVPLFLSGTTLVVGPSASASSNVVGASPASTAMSRGRQRRSTLESWFPLRSFIDLKADLDERLSSWKWRSFIEIGVA